MAIPIPDENWLVSIIKFFLLVQYAIGEHLGPAAPPSADGASIEAYFTLGVSHYRIRLVRLLKTGKPGIFWFSVIISLSLGPLGNCSLISRMWLSELLSVFYGVTINKTHFSANESTKVRWRSASTLEQGRFRKEQRIIEKMLLSHLLRSIKGTIFPSNTETFF